ncbi:MAG: GHKL domain-containing protein [Lachnospiraceae bacterium]|nr:GHKL domain-containing protein [Lachnospiraceae bacterium]
MEFLYYDSFEDVCYTVMFQVVQAFMILYTGIVCESKRVRSYLKLKYIIFTIMYIFLLFIINSFNRDWIYLSLIITIVLHGLMFMLITEREFYYSVTSAIFSWLFMAIFILAGLVIAMLLKLNISAVTGSLEEIVVLCGSFTALIIALRFLKGTVRKLYGIVMEKASTIVVLFLTLICLLIVLRRLFIVFMDDYSISGVSFDDVMPVLFILILILSRDNAERVRKQREADYKKYSSIIDELISSYREERHDLNNKVQSIMALSEVSQDMDEFRKNVEKYSFGITKYNVMTDVLRLDNKLLSGLLHVKYQEALKKNIVLYVHVNNYSFESRADDFDIVDISGILLDNAIEAVEKDSVIEVEIGRLSEDRRFYIAVENEGPFLGDEEIRDMLKRGSTSKADKENHGLGLYIVKKLVDNKQGDLIIENITKTKEDGDKNFVRIEVVI